MTDAVTGLTRVSRASGPPRPLRYAFWESSSPPEANATVRTATNATLHDSSGPTASFCASVEPTPEAMPEAAAKARPPSAEPPEAKRTSSAMPAPAASATARTSPAPRVSSGDAPRGGGRQQRGQPDEGQGHAAPLRARGPAAGDQRAQGHRHHEGQRAERLYEGERPVPQRDHVQQSARGVEYDGPPPRAAGQRAPQVRGVRGGPLLDHGGSGVTERGDQGDNEREEHRTAQHHNPNPHRYETVSYTYATGATSETQAFL